MSNTIKETISLLDEVVSIIGEERPVEPAFSNEDPEGWCDVLAWEEKASQALADLLMVERRKNEKLQAENAELKGLNSTQENLLKACIKWMDGKGCPVPYDLRVALETPPEGE